MINNSAICIKTNNFVLNMGMKQMSMCKKRSSLQADSIVP